ncbi:MAG TPA: hypothetical protein VGA09_11560, partial [Candidatus Binatia bacterium]
EPPTEVTTSANQWTSELSYSITSSAWSRSEIGTVIPSVLAVSRLITLVGALHRQVGRLACQRD